MSVASTSLSARSEEPSWSFSSVLVDAKVPLDVRKRSEAVFRRPMVCGRGWEDNSFLGWPNRNDIFRSHEFRDSAPWG
ncbi:unnamed protein product, partial [Mycena citricolor]